MFLRGKDQRRGKRRIKRAQGGTNMRKQRKNWIKRAG